MREERKTIFRTKDDLRIKTDEELNLLEVTFKDRKNLPLSKLQS